MDCAQLASLRQLRAPTLLRAIPADVGQIHKGLQNTISQIVAAASILCFMLNAFAVDSFDKHLSICDVVTCLGLLRDHVRQYVCVNFLGPGDERT